MKLVTEEQIIEDLAYVADYWFLQYLAKKEIIVELHEEIKRLKRGS